MRRYAWLILYFSLARSTFGQTTRCPALIAAIEIGRHYSDLDLERDLSVLKPSYIQDLNRRTEEFLKSHGVEFREIEANEAFTPPYLERSMDKDDPLYGKFKQYLILSAPPPNHRSVTGLAFAHEDFSTQLKNLQSQGVAVIVDPSISLEGHKGNLSYGGTELRIGATEKWSIFAHEKAHFDFIDQLLGRMLREGYFDELKDLYNKDLNAFHDPKSKGEALPLLAYLNTDVGSKKVARLRARAFTRFAAEMPNDEYQTLIKENSVLAHVVTLVQEGYTDMLTLNEGAATAVQLSLHKDAKSPLWDKDRIAAERYQISFKLDEYQSKLVMGTIDIQDSRKASELMQRDFLLKLLDQSPRGIEEWNRLVQRILAYGGPIILSTQMNESSEEKEEAEKRRAKGRLPRATNSESAER